MKKILNSFFGVTALSIMLIGCGKTFIIALTSDGQTNTSALATNNETRQTTVSLGALNLSNDSSNSNYVAYNCSSGQATFGSLTYDNTGSQYINGYTPTGTMDYLPFSYSQCKTQVTSSNNLIQVNDSILSHFEPSTVALFQGINTFATNPYSQGSAFLLGNGLALTAAHCVFEMNAFMGDPKLFFINNGPNNFAYSYNVSSIYIPKEFYLDGNSNYSIIDGSRSFSLSSQAQNYDWAILKLQTTTLQHSFGAWKIGSKYTLGDVYDLTAGYPAYDSNKKLYAASGQYCESWNEYRYILFQYNAQGMSGGPIIGYYHDNVTLDDYTLCVGLVSTMITYSTRAVCTGGTVFTNELVSLANYVA